MDADSVFYAVYFELNEEIGKVVEDVTFDFACPYLHLIRLVEERI